MAMYESHIRTLIRPHPLSHLLRFLRRRKAMIEKVEQRLDVSEVAVCRWRAVVRALAPTGKVSAKKMLKAMPRPD